MIERVLLLWAGLGYLVIICAGIFAEFVVRTPLRAAGARAAPDLLGLSVAADLIMISADIAVGVLFFRLLSPLGAGLALAALVFRLIQAAALTANTLILAHVSRNGVSAIELQIALADHAMGYQLALVFFGLSLLCLAPLMWRSAAFPAPIAVLTAGAGAAYGLDGLLAPLGMEWAALIAPATTGFAVLAEFTLCGWLLSAPLRRNPSNHPAA